MIVHNVLLPDWNTCASLFQEFTVKIPTFRCKRIPVLKSQPSDVKEYEDPTCTNCQVYANIINKVKPFNLQCTVIQAHYIHLTKEANEAHSQHNCPLTSKS